MKAIPNWQLLIVLYAVMVAVPVYFLHQWFKVRLNVKKSGWMLMAYFLSLPVVAFILHVFAMWLYYKFLFFY